MKSAIKHLIFGPPGLRPHAIKRGLLRGLNFQIETAHNSQRLLGLAEREIMRDVRQCAQAAKSAIDIGAADGWYSLYFASLPMINRVVAIEPSEDLSRLLRDNFALNDPAFMAKLTCVRKFASANEENGRCKVDVLAADLPRPVVLKIDVDGGEIDVLRGAEKLLKAKAALLVVETHSRELENSCLKLLEQFHYDCRIVRNAWYRWLVPETRDVPHNRWLVALPRG